MGHVGHHPGPFLTWLSPPHRPRSPGGRGMPTPRPPSSPTAAHTGAPPGATAAARRVTGRHPPPPIETPTEYAHARIQRPGPARARPGRARLAHPAAVPGQQTAPRQLPAPAAPGTASPAHLAGACPCLPAGGWCHGVRAATTDPATITAWWRREPRAVPGVAAGPSGLVLVDIDAHGGPPPPNLATGLLPGIDLAAEPIPPGAWADPARFRDGRDTLALLARLRGGPRPWPTGPEHQPVTAATPSGGVHLWYQAPAPNLRQALSDPHGRYGLAWQIDLKAGWSYGIAPGATTTAGTYQIRGGDPAHPGHMPAWLAHEVIRATTTAPRQPATPPPPSARRAGPGRLPRHRHRPRRRPARRPHRRPQTRPVRPRLPRRRTPRTGPAPTASTSPASSSTPEPPPDSDHATPPASSTAPSPTESTGR